MESYDFVNNLLIGSLRNLSHTFRFDTLRQIRSENVAEHSFYASAYTLALYHKLISVYPEMAEQFDLGSLLAKAICHDMEERLTGDITRCVKDILDNMEEKAAEISRACFEEEKLPLALADYQEAALALDTLEGRLIKLADLLCVCAKLLEEAELGNQYANHKLQFKMQPYLEGLIRPLTEPDPPDPFNEFAYRILENVRNVLTLRCTCPPKSKPMHTGY